VTDAFVATPVLVAALFCGIADISYCTNRGGHVEEGTRTTRTDGSSEQITGSRGSWLRASSLLFSAPASPLSFV
jgi:hypothetical protein